MKNTYHRLTGIEKVGEKYLCHGCRQWFTLKKDKKLICPCCGNERREKNEKSN